MTHGVLYRHPGSGRERLVLRGWSWVLFLFSPLFGLPLFLRGLIGWGLIMCVIAALGIFSVLHPSAEFALRLQQLVAVLFGVMSLWLGLEGNSITAAHLESRGWEPAEEEEDGGTVMAS